MSKLDQRKFLYFVLRQLSTQFLDKMGRLEPSEGIETISAAAGIIDSVIGDDQGRKNDLIAWLTSSSGAGIGEGIGIRRAAIATIAKDKEATISILEKSLSQFGDQLYIKHAPMLQQEGMLHDIFGKSNTPH
jgi:telomere length regulation protein